MTEKNSTATHTEIGSADVTDISERLRHRHKIDAELMAAESKIHSLEVQLARQTESLAASEGALQRYARTLSDLKHHILEKDALLNSIFNAAIEGIVTINAKGCVVSANKGIEAILGYTERELIGRNISCLMPKTHAEQHDQYIQRYIDTGISQILGKIREVEGLHKDGRIVPLDLSLAEFKIDGAIFFTGILRNCSQRKRQERENREHLEELAHVTRLGLMGELASGIAHEVNQPLTAIAAYVDVCITLLNDTGPGRAKVVGILEKTRHQALRAGKIIHRMRDLVRAKASHCSSVCINRLIEGCIELCASELQRCHIALDMNFQDNIPTAYVNVVQIEQVLLNVIRNAIEATQEMEQGKLRRLLIRTRVNHDNNIEIAVQDNGKGIADAERIKIMEPFYTTKNNGMGMGLSISKSLVEAHQGSIRFESEIGIGSTFYITLPPKAKIDEL